MPENCHFVVLIHVLFIAVVDVINHIVSLLNTECNSAIKLTCNSYQSEQCQYVRA